MGKLIYAANIGFLEDEAGSFDWSVPDEDVQVGFVGPHHLVPNSSEN